jgi:DNA polymerase-3 subunit alpha
MDSLIRAGAMDCFGARRSQLLAVLEKALLGGAASLKDRKSGQLSLFDEFEQADEAPQASLPDIPEFADKERLAMEKEVLGYYLSSHPLAEYERSLRSFCSHTTVTSKHLKGGTEIILGGVISSIKLAHTKNPKPGQSSKYANFDLEDMEGIVRAIAWPNTYERVGELVVPDAIVLVRGKVDKRGEEEINLIVDEIIPIQEADEKFTTGIHILFNQSLHSEEMIPKIREILRGYPGGRDVIIAVRLDNGETVHLKSSKIQVAISPELRERLDDLLGTNSHRLVMTKPKVGAKSGNNEGFRRRTPR